MDRKKILPILLILTLVSLGLVSLSLLGKLSLAEGTASAVFSPLQKIILKTFNIDFNRSNETEDLKKENAMLLKKLSDQAFLESENKALRSQFEKDYPVSHDLLPADVTGSPGFIPGVSQPEYLVINRGEKDGVRQGMAVVMGENLVGKVSRVSSHASKIDLVSDKSPSFTAKAVSYEDGREVSGIIKGEGATMIFGNVLLKDTLKAGDVIMTKGDIDEKGAGFLPNLVVGKIISVEKKSSDLFQKAQVKSPLEFSELSKVFVVLR